MDIGAVGERARVAAAAGPGGPNGRGSCLSPRAGLRRVRAIVRRAFPGKRTRDPRPGNVRRYRFACGSDRPAGTPRTRVWRSSGKPAGLAIPCPLGRESDRQRRVLTERSGASSGDRVMLAGPRGGTRWRSHSMAASASTGTALSRRLALRQLSLDHASVDARRLSAGAEQRPPLLLRGFAGRRRSRA
jgi:hypothetical protein